MTGDLAGLFDSLMIRDQSSGSNLKVCTSQTIVINRWTDLARSGKACLMSMSSTICSSSVLIVKTHRDTIQRQKTS